MATVLIIPTDPMIGGLLGQLTDLAGHAAQFRQAGERPSESVRTLHPDIVMLDAAFAREPVDTIATAASQVGARMVYFAASMGAAELRRFALARGAKYFALPAGPKLLGRVLASALTDDRAVGADDLVLMTERAVSAAVAAVSRARATLERCASTRTASRGLRAEHETALAECRRMYAQLREAVIAYTRELRAAGFPPERALEIVKRAMRAEAPPTAPQPQQLEADLSDATEWCLQAYYAA